MGTCHVCNDFEDGDAQAYPIETWNGKLLSSPCRYCHLLVQAIRNLEPEFFTRLCRQDYDVKGDGQPDVTYRVTVLQSHGLIEVASSCDRDPRLELVIFKSAQGHAPTGENDTLQLPKFGEIAAIPGDTSMWAFLRAALHECLREHSTCSTRQDTTWFPPRLLLLQHGCDGGENIKLRLVDTRHERPQSAYIALSHCWGTEQPLRTTSQTIESHQTDIDWACLTRTFRDTISVAQEMDVFYVWIDSLCIIQGDEEDWA